MRDLTVGIFEHLNITYWENFDDRVKIIERILIGSELKKLK